MAIKFLERYKDGETRTVYNDIMTLQDKAFRQEYYSDILNVLNESCNRIAYNLNIIYNELLALDYNFSKETQYNFQKPLVKPLPNTDKLLTQLDKLVKPYGHVPESIKMFYRVVGSCNFSWDYDSNASIPWEGADPIQIAPLDDLLSELGEILEEDEPLEYLELSADYLHKDNISGGPAYAIEITSRPSIDGAFVHEEHNTTFIDYLRITFENCGFSRAQYINDPEFRKLAKKVGPMLKPI